MAVVSEFNVEKSASLERADLSRKGAIDDAIVPLIEHINSLDEYYTTSSCSGRTCIYSQSPEHAKKGCRWIIVSHVPLETQNIWSVLNSAALPTEGYVFLKFEPFIVHVMCKTLQFAQTMLHVAVCSGFKNSGITVGKKEKVMLAVRSTHSLEAPIALNGQLLVAVDYLQHLVELANQKMAENLHRVERFTEQLRTTFHEGLKADTHSKKAEVFQDVDRRSSGQLKPVVSADDIFNDENAILGLFA